MLYKFGKTDLGRVTQSSGFPTRLHQQIRQLSELYPNSVVKGTVIENLGTITTQQAKAIETNYIYQYFNQTGLIRVNRIEQ